MVISIALYYFFDNGRGEGGGGLGWTGGSSVEEGVGLSLDFKQVLSYFLPCYFYGAFSFKTANCLYLSQQKSQASFQ